MAEPATNSKIPLERLDNGRPRFHGCSKITDYEWISKLGEGTFGEVSKARSKKTGQIVALKKILMHHEKDGFPITALREIKLLKQLDHINILKLEEMAVERPKDVKKKPSMFMVTPYMDHDLSGLLENPAVQFSEPQIKCYMKQLLEGCAYLHENKILHRDMKAANLLINNRGILQIADFGLARPYDDDPPTPGQGGGEATREYTTLVVTRWYRPPELLLQLRKYTTAIDMWGVGCVFGEMFKGKPILAGNSDVNQAQLIFDLVGSPTESNMPGWSQLPGCEGVTEFEPRNSSIDRVFREQSPVTISLLKELLKLDWRKRINAIDALKHPYFHTNPFPALPGDLPSFEESHELDRRKFRDQKNKPPPAPAGGSVGLGPQGEWGINGRPLPYDSRGGNRVPGGSRPYANGHGQGRRPQHPPLPSMRNGDYVPDYRGPPIPREGQTDPYRQPPPYEPPPFNSSRIPPVPTQYDDFSNRQPLPHPQDIGLPPRPPPPSDPYRQAPPPNQHLPYRDDSRGAPPLPRSRLPPTGRRGSDGSTGPSDQSKFQGEVDTYIPSYSNADPNVRRPPREFLREARTDRDRDGRRDDSRRDDSRRRDERPLPRQDGPPIDYGEQPPPTRYDDARGRDAGGHGAGMRPGGAPGAYDRRRSQSPREWNFERDRDRGPRYGQHDDGRYRR